MKSERITWLVEEMDIEVQHVSHECYDPYEPNVSLREAKDIVRSLTEALRLSKLLLKEVKKGNKRG